MSFERYLILMSFITVLFPTFGYADSAPAPPLPVSPPPTCLVMGTVWWPKEDMEPKMRLTTTCPIQIQRDGQFVKMSSPRWSVEVCLPEKPRPQGFLYIWGHSEATIGNHAVPVRFGPAYGL
jgi:hypothetical protein